MDILQDKAKLINGILEVIQESQKEHIGLASLSESLTRSNPNLTIENIAKCLATTMKVTSKQSDRIRTLALIALIVVQSNDFDVDVAKLLNKMGRGEDALKQMFTNKLNGR